MKECIKGGLNLARIVISHNKKEGERWRPFEDKRDIRKVVEDVWESQIKDYFADLNISLSCRCDYPSQISKIRPLTENELKRCQGCLVDIDSYFESKLPYLIEEVNHLRTLRGKVFPGGISKKRDSLTSLDEYWFPRPIKNDKDIADYLERLFTAVVASYKEKLEMWRNTPHQPSKTQLCGMPQM